MNRLLIFGAGQYGRLAKEIAEAMNCFSQIDFLDDKDSSAIGKLDGYKSFCTSYDCAVVAIGRPDIRRWYLDSIKDDIKVISLIHPKSVISPSARIGEGCIVEPLAVVQTAANIGRGCFISSGAVIRHNAIIGDCVHCDCNSYVLSDQIIPSNSKIKAYSGSEVISNF